MQQIYRRLPLSECDFNKVAKELYWNRTSAWVFSCKFPAYFQNNFFENTLWRLLLPHDWYGWLVYIFASSILTFSGFCALACILGSSDSYILMFVYTCLYRHIFNPHILRCMRPHLYPCILISSGSCVVASNLLSLHSLILRLVCSVCLLVSSDPHILVSLDWCTLSGCWHSPILTSSFPYVNILQVLVWYSCILTSSYC